MTVTKIDMDRDTDARVAKAMGWTDIRTGPFYDWIGREPQEPRQMLTIPPFTSRPEFVVPMMKRLKELFLSSPSLTFRGEDVWQCEVPLPEIGAPQDQWWTTANLAVAAALLHLSEEAAF